MDLAIRDLYPGMGMMSTDVCVPISDLSYATRATPSSPAAWKGPSWGT
jgi:hypothetical protein